MRENLIQEVFLRLLLLLDANLFILVNFIEYYCIFPTGVMEYLYKNTKQSRHIRYL